VPTYAYACTACDHQLEIRQSFSDDALTTCPECSGRLRKRFDNVGVVFKGSGFYRTDSRSNGGSGSDTAASGDGAGAKTSGDGGSGTSSTSDKSSDGAAPAKASGGSSSGATASKSPAAASS